MTSDLDHQLSVFKRGADELIVEAELLDKLRRGKPLRIKEGFDREQIPLPSIPRAVLVRQDGAKEQPA